VREEVIEAAIAMVEKFPSCPPLLTTGAGSMMLLSKEGCGEKLEGFFTELGAPETPVRGEKPGRFFTTGAFEHPVGERGEATLRCGNKAELCTAKLGFATRRHRNGDRSLDGLTRFEQPGWLRAAGLRFVVCLLLLAVLFHGLGLVVVARAADDAPKAPPNILFIMSDDHAYQAIGAYGSRVNETPNIDRIAREGMRFDRCFVTNSICGPSRAVILTGKYNHLNGFTTNNDSFNGQQQNVAKMLRSAGYQTAVIGKWHLVSDPTGFDYWHILQGQGPYYDPAMKTPGGLVKHEGYTTDIITEESLRWLKEGRDPSKPFFLMYQHKAPHRNWQPHPRHLDKYKDVEVAEPETLFDDYAGRGTAAKDQQMSIAKDLNDNDLKLVPQRDLTPEQREPFERAYAEENQKLREAKLTGDELTRWKYQRYVKDYLRCIDAVDENVGRVLDYLDESGLAENTVVIYTSDQGWYLGEHGWYDKRWMYEESFRTPLLVRWPGKIKPASVNAHLAMNLDFAQTFLDIAGVVAPGDMQGRSLVPLLHGKTPDDWRKSVYYHYYEFPQPHHVHPHYGVRTARHKLIHFYTLNEWELYDLEKDPHEMRSVYAEPEYADVVVELNAELKRLREQYKDDGSVVEFEPQEGAGGAKRGKKAKGKS
jgi:arylsulfatase A-like enzyme